jgi:hypothetical protein
MPPCPESERRRELFRKYRKSLATKADMSKQHQAEIWILLVRNDKWYRIAGCSSKAKSPDITAKASSAVKPPCSEARRRKELFRKYRKSLDAKAKMAKQHQAEIWILMFRNDKWYPVAGHSSNVRSPDVATLVSSAEGLGWSGQGAGTRPETRGRPGSPSQLVPRQGFTLIEPVPLRPSQEVVSAHRCV